ncbi:MAG: CAP domain-containing protein [Ruminococcaceae bacterium]|nr:CAP domain-containing protein [Oscillospiraceae bacterium]
MKKILALLSVVFILGITIAGITYDILKDKNKLPQPKEKNSEVAELEMSTTTEPVSLGEYKKEEEIIYNETNKYRKEIESKELILDFELCRLATIRAAEIQKDFSSNRPDGHPNFYVLIENKYKFKHFAENIWRGKPETAPEEIINEWYNDPVKQENMLHPQIDRIGIGFAEIDGELFVVQIFVET